jgi:hypothetical protein
MAQIDFSDEVLTNGVMLRVRTILLCAVLHIQGRELGELVTVGWVPVLPVKRSVHHTLEAELPGCADRVHIDWYHVFGQELAFQQQLR